MALAAPDLIHAQRVHIRLLAEPDLPALLEVNGDDAVTRFLPYDTWKSMDDARAWHKRVSDIQATGTALQFVVVDTQLNQAVGSCLLFRFDAQSARAELGYVLGRAHWGKGLMREALTALIGSAFAAMSLRRLEAEIDPRNAASTQLISRLGFTREGLLRQRWITKGEARDVAAFGLLSHEWPPGPRQQVDA